MKGSDEIEIQRQFFADIAQKYQDECVHQGVEHFFALSFLVASIDYFEFESVLDIGSGTGRAISYIKEKRPHIRIVGVEPVKELREVGYGRGISEDALIDGDAMRLGFSNGEFDLVCEFGALHHIRKPTIVVSEMLRVAKKGIFISDGNNFGHGSPLTRSIKQFINLVKLWPVANFIKTRGKGYTISEGDGLAYSYSVFNNYNQIRRHCKSVHILNTRDAGVNAYRSASHIALLGLIK